MFQTLPIAYIPVSVLQYDVQGCTNVAMIWISKSDRTSAVLGGRMPRAQATYMDEVQEAQVVPRMQATYMDVGR